jgi:hypothetical protein
MMHCGIAFNLIMHQFANAIGTLLICMYSLSMLAITIQFNARKKSKGVGQDQLELSICCEEYWRGPFTDPKLLVHGLHVGDD